MSRVRMGFIGAGFIARFQCLAVEQVRGVDLVGVVSPNRAGPARKGALHPSVRRIFRFRRWDK